MANLFEGFHSLRQLLNSGNNVMKLTIAAKYSPFSLIMRIWSLLKKEITGSEMDNMAQTS